MKSLPGILGVLLLMAFPWGHEKEEKVHELLFCEYKPRIDGRLDDICWQKAAVESSFFFPWETRPAPLTQFQAIQTQLELCFAFLAVDEDIVVVRRDDSEDEVAQGDRVELFLSTDVDLTKYYCLEIDPEGRVLDYSASMYRNFDTSWNAKTLQVAVLNTSDGYIAEGCWSLQELRGLGIVQKEGKIRAGLFRAEYGSGPGTPLEGWISWVDPATPSPDFHVPSAFGWIKGASLPETDGKPGSWGRESWNYLE